MSWLRKLRPRGVTPEVAQPVSVKSGGVPRAGSLWMSGSQAEGAGSTLRWGSLVSAEQLRFLEASIEPRT